MKKIFQLSYWDTAVLTSDAVSNKTHWAIKALDYIFGLLGYTPTYTVPYSGQVYVDLYNEDGSMVDGRYTITMGDGNQVSRLNDSAFLFYVDTENKEFCGCACTLDAGIFDYLTAVTDSEAKMGNVVTTPFFLNAGRLPTRYGPMFIGAVKNNHLMGCCINGAPVSYSTGLNNQYFFPIMSVANYMPSRFESVAPLISTGYRVKYGRYPILDGGGSALSTCNPPAIFHGDYFQSIFMTDGYFTKPMKTEDNTKYLYDGKLFLVDDATDIGIIEITV